MGRSIKHLVHVRHSPSVPCVEALVERRCVQEHITRPVGRQRMRPPKRRQGQSIGQERGGGGGACQSCRAILEKPLTDSQEQTAPHAGVQDAPCCFGQIPSFQCLVKCRCRMKRTVKIWWRVKRAARQSEGQHCISTALHGVACWPQPPPEAPAGHRKPVLTCNLRRRPAADRLVEAGRM